MEMIQVVLIICGAAALLSAVTLVLYGAGKWINMAEEFRRFVVGSKCDCYYTNGSGNYHRAKKCQRCALIDKYGWKKKRGDEDDQTVLG